MSGIFGYLAGSIWKSVGEERNGSANGAANERGEESAWGRRNGPPRHDFLPIADNLRSSMIPPSSSLRRRNMVWTVLKS